MVKVVEPGGSLSTNFGQRSGSEAGTVQTPSDYDAFIAASRAVFEALGAIATASAEDVAKVIYEAASDGSDRLRYVATDDIEPMIKARRETSEEEYIAYMRSRFMLAACGGCIEQDR